MFWFITLKKQSNKFNHNTNLSKNPESHFYTFMILIIPPFFRLAIYYQLNIFWNLELLRQGHEADLMWGKQLVLTYNCVKYHIFSLLFIDVVCHADWYVSKLMWSHTEGIETLDDARKGTLYLNFFRWEGIWQIILLIYCISNLIHLMFFLISGQNVNQNFSFFSWNSTWTAGCRVSHLCMELSNLYVNIYLTLIFIYFYLTFSAFLLFSFKIYIKLLITTNYIITFLCPSFQCCPLIQ